MQNYHHKCNFLIIINEVFNKLFFQPATMTNTDGTHISSKIINGVIIILSHSATSSTGIIFFAQSSNTPEINN
jgi:hypothetical protein